MSSVRRVGDDLSTIPGGEFHKKFHELCVQQRIEVPIAIKILKSRGLPPMQFPASPSNIGLERISSQETSNIFDELIKANKQEQKIAKDIFDEFTRVSKQEQKIPKIFVELEQLDAGDSVKEILIRGWLIDDRMLSVLQESCVYLERLSVLTLWDIGMKTKMFKSFHSWLASIPNLKRLSLDSNPLLDEDKFHLFLKEPIKLESASFRFCNITDAGAILIGKALGCPTSSNSTLIKLNLTGNQIRDGGAIGLANGLRLNDTLVVLSLSKNQIGNKGAKAMADMLSSSELSKEELRQRRFLLFERVEKKSSYEIQKGTAEYEEAIKEDKSDKTKTKNKIGPVSLEKRRMSTKQDNSLKKQYVAPDTICNLSKLSPEEIEFISAGGNDTPENILLHRIHSIPDKGVFLCGNLTLLSLNLDRNEIGISGLEALLRAVTYQNSFSLQMHNLGLMRLILTNNFFDENHPIHNQLTVIMESLDPLNNYIQNLNQASAKILLEQETNVEVKDLDKIG